MEISSEIVKYLIAALVAGNMFFIRDLVRKMNKTYAAVIKLGTRVQFLEKRLERVDSIKYVGGNGFCRQDDDEDTRRDDDD